MIIFRVELASLTDSQHVLALQPGVVGVCEVVREAHPDETALDPESPKYDPKSTSEKPRWFMVDVKFVSFSPPLNGKVLIFGLHMQCAISKSGNQAV